MHEDDAVQAHDRMRACRPRTSAEQERPEDPTTARVPELSALLGELDGLRLALSADLGLAASAVEVGAFDVARDVIAGGQHDVAGFSARAEQLLAPREPEDDEPTPAEPEVVPLAPRRPARRLALLAPALTAAAALVGLLAGVVPSPGAPGPTGAPMINAAHDSYAELWRLHDGGAPPSLLAQAARDLHSEVARLVALAATDPAGAEQALRLLELELALLDDPQHGGALGPERAESQRLLARLRQALGRTPVGEVLAQAPQTARSAPAAVTPLVVVPLPEAPLAAPELPQGRSAEPSASPSATPAPAQQPTPASQPSPAPEQDTAPNPSPQSEPEPSPGALLPPRPSGSMGAAQVLDPTGD